MDVFAALFFLGVATGAICTAVVIGASAVIWAWLRPE